jgi:cell division inhibitor SepF
MAKSSWLRNLIHPFDDDDDDDLGGFPTAPPEPAPAPRPAPTPSAGSKGFGGGFTEQAANSGQGVQIRNIHATALFQIALSNPERYDKKTATEIGDQLRAKRTVLLNLEKMDKEESSRQLLNFLSGVAFALDGQVKKVAVNTVLIVPYNVDLMGDIVMEELENNSSDLYYSQGG